MRIHVLGDAFCDIVAHGVTGLPKWGTGTRSSGIGQFPGGSALNTAVHLKSILGATSDSEVVLFTALGEDIQDWASQVLMRHLEIHNVKLKATRIPGKPTGVCIVLSGPGDRSFVTCAGAVSTFTLNHIDIGDLAQCDHIHFGGLYSLNSLVEDLPKLMNDLRKQNPMLTMSLDTNFDDTDEWGFPWLGKILPLIDIIKQNEEEAEGVLRRHGNGRVSEPATFLGSTVRTAAVVTKGKDGAIVSSHSDPSKIITIPSYTVNVVDCCGAGDAWNAGFIAHWLSHGRNDVQAAAEFACACGAVSITQLGACQVPVTKDAVSELLAKHSSKRLNSGFNST